MPCMHMAAAAHDCPRPGSNSRHAVASEALCMRRCELQLVHTGSWMRSSESSLQIAWWPVFVRSVVTCTAGPADRMARAGPAVHICIVHVSSTPPVRVSHVDTKEVSHVQVPAVSFRSDPSHGHTWSVVLSTFARTTSWAVRNCHGVTEECVTRSIIITQVCAPIPLLTILSVSATTTVYCRRIVASVHALFCNTL